MRCRLFIFHVLASLAAGAAKDPVQVTIADLQDEKHEDSLVEFTGTVDDAFRDEIDHRVGFMILNSSNHIIAATISAKDRTDAEIEDLIGAKLLVTGWYFIDRSKRRNRLFFKQQVSVDRGTYTVLERAQKDLFTAPLIDILSDAPPAEIPLKGRHRVLGRVEATWGGDKVFLSTADGGQCRIQLRHGPLPQYGDFIEAVGLPETDLYRINLTRAIWRSTAPAPAANTTTPSNGVSSIVTYQNGSIRYSAPLYGRPVRIRGIVRSLPGIGNNGIFSLESEGTTVSIDASAIPEELDKLALGAIIEVTGLCIFEVPNWRAGSAFPHITGFCIVLRQPTDVVVIANPPWWTPAKLLTVIALLGVGLVVILLRESIERRIARLRFADRTRLAIELHDSVSQNLSSVSLQVDAARELIDCNLNRARARLDIASKTIDSCRDELKNCIRDLRDATLDTDDFNAAIRKVLSPVLADATLAVRFNVPRNRLSDNAAHSVLCIVRELATNAIRHGHATLIRVAGTLDRNQLLFSVSDNGCGFAPDDRPGVDEGHFGLEGVAERVRGLNGRFKLSSSPGSGTRAVLVISKLTGGK